MTTATLEKQNKPYIKKELKKLRSIRTAISQSEKDLQEGRCRVLTPEGFDEIITSASQEVQTVQTRLEKIEKGGVKWITATDELFEDVIKRGIEMATARKSTKV